MDRAIELSILNVNKSNGGPFGAVIMKDNKIISEGVNLVVKTNDPTAHAEIIAIRNACNKLNTYDLSGCTIYTSCYPCSMCYSSIRWARIDQIYYANTREDAHNIGFSDVDIYEEIKHKMNGDSNRKIPNIIHIKNDKALEAFNIWTEDKEKIQY